MPRDLNKSRAQKAEIDSICAALAWTQKQLAERAGLKPGTLGRVSSGYSLSAASIASIRNAASAEMAERGQIREEPKDYQVNAAAQIREHVEGLIDERGGDVAELYWLLKELRDNYPRGLANSASERAQDTALDVAAAAARRPIVKSSQ